MMAARRTKPDLGKSANRAPDILLSDPNRIDRIGRLRALSDDCLGNLERLAALDFPEALLDRLSIEIEACYMHENSLRKLHQCRLRADSGGKLQIPRPERDDCFA